MQTLERVLADHPFFEGWSPQYVQLLTGCAANVRFSPGDYIVREGDAADHFYLIRHGKVAIETESPGQGAIWIQTVEDGDVLGWSWLVPPYRWRFDARATEDVRALSLDGKCLRGKCEDDHDLGYELYRRVCHIMEQRLQATRTQLLEFHTAWWNLMQGR